MSSLRHLIAQDEVVEGLRNLATSAESGFARPELESRLLECGIASPSDIVDQLLGAGLIALLGPRLSISHLGQRAHLLAEALDGGDIEDIVRRLRLASGQREMYELVREGMTTTFVRSLIERPGFRRLFICSPWINPSEKDASVLKYAFYSALKQQPDAEVLVIVRPPEDVPPETIDGLKPLREIGARVYFNRKVHSKLYIREPDSRGGAPMAIVGSQNLTRSTYVELGIRINGDARLIDKLIRYFLELASRSSESDQAEE